MSARGPIAQKLAQRARAVHANPMRFLAALPLILASCIDFSLTPKNKRDGGVASGDLPDAAGDGGTIGLGCGTDVSSGATLCLGVTACPGLVIDSAAFPQCGFRLTGGSTLDLECVCSGYLCPVGVATSCTAAKQLLQNQTQPGVCLQLGEGRCVSGTPVKPPNSGCDKTCASQCGGDPTCIQGCGC